jgi:hypothetical protein
MPGPTATDSNFERTFADLAYARLRDKAPSLLDYLIGFQLIDKNDEETHAVGVFGFKVGKDWVYCPVFFINGELKGHELMYIKNQDAFVPMMEQWVNYILNRRPRILGELEQTPRYRLGLRQPDFDIFARTPYIGSKYASARPTFKQICASMERSNPDFLPFMDAFLVSPMDQKYASLNRRFTLPGALKSLGKQAAVNLFETMRRDESFAEAVLKNYNIQDLVGYEKQAEDRVSQVDANYNAGASFNFCKDCNHYQGNRTCEVVSGDISPQGTCKNFKPKAVKNEIEPIAGLKSAAEMDEIAMKQRAGHALTLPKAVVITRGDDGSNAMLGLSDEDKRRLLREQYVVKDPRTADQKTRLYKSQIAATVVSPHESGFYDLLTPAGDTRRVLILRTPIPVGHAWRRRDPTAIVVDTENKRYGGYANDDLLTSKWYGKDDLTSFYNGLSSPSSLKPGDKALLMTECGASTTTFRVTDKVNHPDGRMEVRVYGDACFAPSSSLPHHRNHLQPASDHMPDDVDCLVFTGKDGYRATQIGQALFIPNGFKAYILSSESGWEQKKDKCPKEDLGAGGWNDLLMTLHKTSAAGKTASLKLLTDGIRFIPVVNEVQGPRMSKVAAIKYLIEGQGLDQMDAEMLVKEAQPKKAVAYFVKYAYGEPPTQATFNEPRFGDEYGIKAPVQYPQLELQNLGQNDNLSARELYRNDRYLDYDAKQYAQTASNLGQKEVLDTAVITGLVKTLDTENAVDSYISDLMLGLDRVGRILFMYYWHNDKFKDRYGQQDMAELEDNLRNVFKQLGELTLFLKQKTVEPEQMETGEVKLDSVTAS